MLLVKCFLLFLFINCVYCSECNGTPEECLRLEIFKLQQDLLPLTSSLPPNTQQYLPFGALESDWNRLLSLESMLPAGHPLRLQLTKSFLLLVQAVREALEHQMQQAAPPEIVRNGIDDSNSVEEVKLDDILRYEAGSKEQVEQEFGTVVASDESSSVDDFGKVLAEGLVGETVKPAAFDDGEHMLADMQYEDGITEKITTEKDILDKKELIEKRTEDLIDEKKVIVEEKVEKNDVQNIEHVPDQNNDLKVDEVKSDLNKTEIITENKEVTKLPVVTTVKNENSEIKSDILEIPEIPPIDDELDDTTHINFPVIDQYYIIGDVEEIKTEDPVVHESENGKTVPEENTNIENGLNKEKSELVKPTEAPVPVDLPESNQNQNLTEINHIKHTPDIQDTKIDKENLVPIVEEKKTMIDQKNDDPKILKPETDIEKPKDEIKVHNEEPKTTIPPLVKVQEEIPTHQEVKTTLPPKDLLPDKEQTVNPNSNKVPELINPSEKIDLEKTKEIIKPESKDETPSTLNPYQEPSQEVTMNYDLEKSSEDLQTESEELLSILHHENPPMALNNENEKAIDEELHSLLDPELNNPTSDLPSFKIIEGEVHYGINNNEGSPLLQEEIQIQEHYPNQETTTNVNNYLKDHPYTTEHVFGDLDAQNMDNGNKVPRSTTLNSILNIPKVPELKSLDRSKDIVHMIDKMSSEERVTEDTLRNLESLQYFTKRVENEPIVEYFDNSMPKQADVVSSENEDRITEIYIPESTTQHVMKIEDYLNTQFPDFQNTASTIADSIKLETEDAEEMRKELMKQKDSPKWAKNVIYKYLEEKHKSKPQSLDKYAKYEKEISKLSMTTPSYDVVNEEMLPNNPKSLENVEQSLNSVPVDHNHNIDKEEIEEIMEYSDGIKNLERKNEDGLETPMEEIQEEETVQNIEEPLGEEILEDQEQPEEIVNETEDGELIERDEGVERDEAGDEIPEEFEEEPGAVEENEEFMEQEQEEELIEEGSQPIEEDGILEETPAEENEAEEEFIPEDEEPVEEAEEPELLEEEPVEEENGNLENEYAEENQSQPNEDYTPENWAEPEEAIPSYYERDTNQDLLRNLDNSGDQEQNYSQNMEEVEYTTMLPVVNPPAAGTKPKITVDTLDALNRIIFGTSYNPTKLRVHEVTTKKPAPLLLTPLDPHRYHPLPKWDLKLLHPPALVLPPPPPIQGILLPAPRSSRFAKSVAMNPPHALRPEEDDLYRWFFSKFKSDDAQKVSEHLKRGEDLPQFEYRGARIPYKVGDIYSGHHN